MIAARITLSDLLEQVYVAHRPLARPRTLKEYRLLVSRLTEYAGRTVYADELCEEFLLGYRQARLHGGGELKRFVRPLPPTTVNKDLRHAKALWALAVRKGLNSQTWGRIDPLEEDLDNLPAWSIEELAAILRACQQESELFFQVPAKQFWRALILVIYDVGPRISAIMDSRREALDVPAKTITLRARVQKTHLCQVLALSDQTIEALTPLLEVPGDWLFPWPYDRESRDWRALRRRYKRILRRAGLPAGRIDLFHRLRRTTATHLYNARGLAATQEHLGHSASRVTVRYLDRTKLTRTLDTAQALPRPLFD